MHDGSHGSFSENKVLNRFAGLTLNFLGCSSFLWNIKHNVIHHTYTNVDGHDDDIENEPFMRMCPSQKHFGIHRFQHFYWPFIYGIMYVAWVFFLDVRKYFRRRISLKENIEIPVSVHIGFWLTKIIYTLIFVVIPITQVGFLPFLLGYSVFVFTTGVVISVIFQLAHCVEDLEFHDAHTIDKLDSDWATHQLATTANFATQSKIVSFFTGGLNYQIEHHLFPKISHVHYPEVSKIVRDVCTKYNITYFENRTLAGAVVSHVKFLRRMGRKN
jgi:linoleoyl-CoA desaturase